MAYQRFKTPRAYIDMIQPLLEKGIIPGTDQITGSGILSTASSIIQLFDNKPNNTITIGGNGGNTTQNIIIDTNLDDDGFLLNEPLFVAILGHNFKTADAKFKIMTDDASDFGSPKTPTMTNVCNGTISSNYAVPANDGWSLITFSQSTDNRYQKLVIDAVTGNYDEDIKIGCILWGTTYDFPRSPDLDIKKTILFNGLKINESLGGQKYAHATHLSNSDWNVARPFSIHTQQPVKSGRIKLDISFSFLDDSDVYISDLYRTPSQQTDDSILNKIVWLTNGGMFPLLLQYDKDNADIDDGFLWCRLDNTPSFNQVAHRQWSTDMSFVEEF